MTTAELRGPRYSELAALYLQARGVSDARPRPLRRFSEAVLDDAATTADLVGVGNFYLTTRASYSLGHLSEALDRADERGRREGLHPAVIWFRRERGIGENYVVLTLGTLADLMIALQDRDVA